MAANRIRVPIKGSVGKSILLPTGGNGATIGLDLKLPNGTVPTLAQLAAALGVNSTPVVASSGGSGANPTAKVGLTVVNGTLTTFMRSDAAPPIDQTIAPTWTGIHTFSPTTGNALQINANDGDSAYNVAVPSGATVGAGIQFFVGSTGEGWFGIGGWAATGAAIGDFAVGAGSGNKLRLVYGGPGYQGLLLDTNGSVQVGNPAGGSMGAGTLNAAGLYVNGVAVGGGGGAPPFFGGPALTPPPSTGWAWEANPGGASVASVFSGAALSFTIPSVSSDLNWYGRAATSSTLTVTACFTIQRALGGTYTRYGIYVRNTTSGAIEEFSVDLRAAPPGLSAYRDTNYTTYATTFFSALSTDSMPTLGVPIWLRIANNASNNLTFSASWDGVNFTPLGTDTAAYVGAVGEIGLLFENDGGAPAYVTLYSFNVTYP